MPVPLVTSALSQAGVRLLDLLIDRAQEAFARKAEAVYHIIEHWARDVLDPDGLRAVFDSAQDDFTRELGPRADWLQLLAALIEHGGQEAVESFTENLWRAYFFRMESAAEALWASYPDIQREVAIRSRLSLPRVWGDWVLPMQTLMGLAEEALIALHPAFERLLVSEDVLELLEEAAPSPIFETPTILESTFEIGSQIDAATALATYLAAFREWVEHLDPRGFGFVSGTYLPLDSVYVPLRLVPLSACRGVTDHVRYQTCAYTDAPFLLLHSLDEQEITAHPGLSVPDVLARHRLVLILGRNGSGKTTLLRYLAFEYARTLLDRRDSGLQIETEPDGALLFKLDHPLPIYVDLADYLEGRQPGESLQEFITRAAADLARDDTVALLLPALLANGQCLILLDGLDRGATDEQRRMLVASVAQAAGHWRAAGNQVVVTSRPCCYAATPLPHDFAEYVIRPLDRGQIGPFLVRWSLALARLQNPLLADEDALRQAETTTLTLIREVTTNLQLQALAGSPWVLRLMIGIYQPGTHLPSRLAAIYQEAAEALIRAWRLPQSETYTPAVLEHEVVYMLGELAFWIHASRPSGMLDEREMVRILGHSWQHIHPDASPDLIEETIDRFVRHIRRHPGLLLELAPDRYGFVHQGMQEYFAARHLVASFRLAAGRIRPILHDPRWETTIRLAVSLVALRSRDDASELIEIAILARGERAELAGYTPSPFEELLRRDLFLAASLLGSGVEVNPTLSAHIAEELMALWLHGDRDSLGRFYLLFDSARHHLIGLDSSAASRRAFQIACQHLSDDDERTRAFAADALSFWPMRHNEAIDALLEHEGEVPVLLRRAIAASLGRMSNLSTKAYQWLFSLVSDEDEPTRQISKRVLRDAPPAPPGAFAMWLEFLSGSPAGRRVSLRTLKEIGTLPDMVINELLHLLNRPDAETRQQVLDTFSGVTHLPDHALMTICRLAVDAQGELRLAAIRALQRSQELPEEVLKYLIEWTHDPDSPVRRAATLALGACRNQSPQVIEALIDRLGDPAENVRAAAIEPLALKGQDNPRVWHLLTHAASDSHPNVRCAVAAALRHFPRPGKELRHALRLLLSDGDITVRQATLDTLALLDDPGEELIDYLISLVTVPHTTIASKAVGVLASLRNLSDVALLTLVQTLPTHWETHGEAIRSCLQAHVPLHMEVVNQIMDLAVLQAIGTTQAMRLSPTRLRAYALDVLGYTLPEAPDALRILLDAARESGNTEVQVAALRGLAHAGVMWPEVKQTLLDLLNQGPLQVRCAAGITLGHLIRSLPDPPLSADEMTDLAESLAALLAELRPRAAWESGNEQQNDLLLALAWIVARSRPTNPRLASGKGPGGAPSKPSPSRRSG